MIAAPGVNLYCYSDKLWWRFFPGNTKTKQKRVQEVDLTNYVSYPARNLMLMRSGVPADVRDDHGNTILLVACQNGHKRALKVALRRGADINAKNSRGNTALHFFYAFGG